MRPPSRRAADPAVQEQRRRQGRQLRHPRELPHGPPDHVPGDRRRAHPVLRHPAGGLRRRPGRHRPVRRRGGYQLAQRSDYIEVEVGLETTLKRGIINTRDEPHADADKYRRLHVIIGDANMSEYSTLLKVGTTALVLDMIEAGVRFDELRLAEPVRSVHRISHDPTLKTTVDLSDGRKMTGLDMQRAYFEKARKHVENTMGADVDDATAEVLQLWGEVLDALARDPWSAPTGWTGRRSCGCWRATGSATGWPGTRAAGAGRPAVHRRPDGQGPLQPAGRRAAR